MFSGIIKAIGKVEALCHLSHELKISSDLFNGQALGDSVAVDGVCLTLKALENPPVLNSSVSINSSVIASFDLGTETRSLTRLGQLKTGDLVNLELALRFGDRLGGHLVSGHVDGLATVVERRYEGENLILKLSYPDFLQTLIVKKGSVALNGVSLTLNQLESSVPTLNKLEKNSLSVCLVPFSLAHTNLGQLNLGDQVHIEADIIGRYLVRLASLGEASCLNTGLQP